MSLVMSAAGGGRNANPIIFYIVLMVVGTVWTAFPDFLATVTKATQSEWKAKYFTRRFFRIAGLVQLALGIVGLLVLAVRAWASAIT